MNCVEKLIYRALSALKRACPSTEVLTAVFLAGAPLMAQPMSLNGLRGEAR